MRRSRPPMAADGPAGPPWSWPRRWRAGRPPRFVTSTLVGQIVAIDRGTNYVTVQHGDIKGFMPGMTMPFAVKDPSLLVTRVPGDLITATLMVQNTDAWIARLTRTGSAPLPAAGARPVPGLAPGDRVSDQTFVDQDGAPLTMEWVDGHVAVVTFSYTRCPLPDFCPAIDRRFLRTAVKPIKSASGASGRRAVAIGQHRTRRLTGRRCSRRTPGKLGADPRRVAVRDCERAAELRCSVASSASTCATQASAASDIEHNLRTVVLDRNRRDRRGAHGALAGRPRTWTARLRTVTGA